jgi:Fe-S-cluster containining protein
MTIPEKVKAVESVFEDLDAAINAFQQDSGLRCKSGCGKCCFKPDIHASILEFLPLAYHLYREANGNPELYRMALENETGLCVILNDQQSFGMCSRYQYRGLICRLFGFSARRNKYGLRELVTCQIIKTEQEDAYTRVSLALKDEGKEVPVFVDYYQRLRNIDEELGGSQFPINEAIRRAFEFVMHYYSYRDLSEG